MYSYVFEEDGSEDLCLNLLKDLDTSPPYHGIEYILNKNKYRSDEFKKNPDTIFLGCSFTYGLGLPVEYTWSKILSKSLYLDHINLSNVGDSAFAQVRRAFAYFSKYGNPKNIFALFPLHRIEIPINTKYLIPQDFKNNLNYEKIQSVMIPTYSPIDPYAKKPYVIQNILNPELSIFFTHQSILILQQYCESNNINFIWSTWEENYSRIYDKINGIDNNYYRNYIDIKMNDWDFDINIMKDNYILNNNCMHTNLDESLPFFERGLDRHYGIKSSHWGAHRNYHIAEIYLNAFKNVGINKNV